MTVPFLLGSYITGEEYRAAPTAQNTQNLIPNGTQAQQDGELAALILKASRQMDIWARQPLYATTSTQNDEDVPIKNGDAILKARQDRVKQLTAFAWGCHWTALATLASPNCYIEEDRVRVQLSAGNLQWSGSLNLNRPSYGKAFVQWSYVAGWASTRLSAIANTGASTITVDNPAGIVGPGQVAPTVLVLTDTDGLSKAEVTVQSVSGSTVTLASPLPQAFQAGAGVAESEDIKQGVILAVTHYIKQRKGGGVVMARTPTNATTSDMGGEMKEAQAIAERFQRKNP